MNTLVLSPGFEPVARVTWQRAVTLLYEGKVQVIEEHEATVRSPSTSFRMPSVVRFIRPMRPRKRVVKFSRENVYARDRGSCQYCGEGVARDEATYDHVQPRALGGQTVWDNVVICCTPCNQKKGPRTPEQAGMRLRSVPVKPKSLPDTARAMLRRGDPESWHGYFRS